MATASDPYGIDSFFDAYDRALLEDPVADLLPPLPAPRLRVELLGLDMIQLGIDTGRMDVIQDGFDIIQAWVKGLNL